MTSRSSSAGRGRDLLAIVVVGGALLCQVVFAHAAPPGSAEPAGGRDEWFIVKYLGRPVGYTRTLVVETDGGWQVTVEAALRLRGEAGVTETSFIEESTFDRDLAGLTFRYRQLNGTACLEVTGRRVAGGLEITMLPAGGAPGTRLLVSPEPIIPMASLWFYVTRRMSGVGASFTVNGLVEPLAVLAPVTVTVGPEEAMASSRRGEAVRKVTLAYSSYRETSWVTADGRTVAEVSDEGLESVPAGAAEARAACGSEPISLAGFLTSVSVRPDRPLPPAADIGLFSLRVDGLPADFPLPAGDFQEVTRLEDYRDPAGLERLRAWVRIRRAASPDDTTVQTPVTDAAGDPRLSTFLQDDHPTIRRIAADITRDLRGDWEKAVAIGRWVHDTIRKDMSDAFSSLQVLEAGKGECQSHALLMAGLCRAAGLPVRIVAGLAWLEERGAFFYHAWVEIRCGGVWYPMDPTYGQFPATAGRLKLLDEGVTGQWRLLGVVNRITLSVTDVRSRPGVERSIQETEH